MERSSPELLSQTQLFFCACRVAVLERGPLKGREQEWNLSRKELEELVGEGLLSAQEADECVASAFNPVRAGFHGGRDVWTENVLNIGVRPDRIIERVNAGFFNVTKKSSMP